MPTNNLITGGLVVVVGLVTFAALMAPRLVGSSGWRATVTPLASIIGSGFLVAGPILSHVAGRWAVVAMAGLCLVGYLFGSAIRTNIRLVEPRIAAGTAGRALLWIEDLSALALTFAYFISVAYYLNLLGAYLLRVLGVVDPGLSKSVTSAFLILIGGIGVIRGLRGLEYLELVTVAIKLAVIVGVLGGLAWFNGSLVVQGSFTWPPLDRARGLGEVATLLGLVIMVQGFEISRYLGDDYSAELRIRTMRFAQVISTAIYVAFILLVTTLFQPGLPASGGESAIIDIVAPVAPVIAPLLILAALASQFSAAVADMGGAGGLLREVSGHRLGQGWGYLLVALFGLILTWSTDFFEIVVYASKAFAFYYGLQCIAAMIACHRAPGVSSAWMRIMVHGVGVLLALAIIVFGTSVEHG